MKIGVLIPPASAWRPRKTIADKPSPRQVAPRNEDWQDLAQQERWKESVMAYLQENWRGGSGFWHVINSVASEAMPECRWQTRDFTRQVLGALMELIREKRVMRFKGKWVAALDLPQENVALEDIPKGRLVRI